MKHPLPTASTSSNASTSEQRTGVSTGQRQTSIMDFSNRPVTDKRRQWITDLLINFVVKDVRPLSALSGEGFRDIMDFFEPGYKIPSHATLWSNIMLQYNTVKARIANEMKDKSVSLTTGNTVTRQRSSLLPSHVDALVFLNANQKSGKVDVIVEDSK
ncbi:hypothetical protein NHX12_006608 [Muraenolepis orangiensis]|uniref:Hermes trasposase DNA-binding domain-containing protein n=1 Tax=Muraenolepis orangiensis TaxID=630683 RepID=A0A9Q0DTW4_9TELE|nr:hypothetical protein NHX12_017216 [Muraenolepis orangiensis]KAJ3594277.1 hypothetical protein NHX12_006608 [Muraenolepis orangiensis]